MTDATQCPCGRARVGCEYHDLGATSSASAIFSDDTLAGLEVYAGDTITVTGLEPEFCGEWFVVGAVPGGWRVMRP